MIDDRVENKRSLKEVAERLSFRQGILWTGESSSSRFSDPLEGFEMRLYGMVLGGDIEIEGETNALPCVLLIWDGAFSSAVRRGVEIGERNDACEEMSSGQTATSVDLSRSGLGGAVRGIGWSKEGESDRLTGWTMCKAVLEHPQGQIRVCEDK